ncbi:phage head morphogenesis protein [Acinetobacter faecalis]|uniref:phage head morphogenesis protein n=1 Tax=Acinetobacter faecalis TaxID=2665161 RepID=UPI002A908ECF|nr:phage minor head protein [Acinetobacter faecalis]MDY6450700.1 phage minor head protein [Acinetobacter faecalis]
MNQIRHTPNRARKVEKKYGRQLRQIASYVDSIIKGFDVTDETVSPSIVTALRKYAESLDIWAKNASSKIIMDIALRDERTWLEYSKDMSVGIRKEIRETDIGMIVQQEVERQVGLIKSLPLEAAQRVQDLSIRAIIEGGRADEISGLIMATGQVTKVRADTIARTEVSRASTIFTKARAESLGSEGYIWRSAEDADVRDRHRELNGKFFKWDEPPIADEKSGIRAHAGCIWNCRCYPEPVIPEE